MKKVIKILFLILLLPSIAFAQSNQFMIKLKKLVGVLVEIVVIVTVIEFVYAGLLIGTAGGDTEKVRKAKDILVYGTIGIGVAAMAWALTKLIESALL